MHTSVWLRIVEEVINDSTLSLSLESCVCRGAECFFRHKVALVAERSVLSHKVAFVAERSVLSHKVALVAERSVLSHAI